jgi:16S rRNA (cytidine1402-2'-O)-methyltransferase
MTAPAGGDGAGPDIDPEVLEELEAWGGPDPDDAPQEAGPGLPEGGSDPARDEAGGAGGYVVLVGTPIGNLGDLSPRAVQALEGSDVIYCEDTRHSRKLLAHAGVTGVPLRSLHRHNEDDRIAHVLRAVDEGRIVAVVSDAGMPGISDPGSRLVAAAVGSGVTVTVVPGPSAVVTALVSSGLATDRFCFEGFLPRSGRDRRERLDSLAREPRTSVLFEAPGRVADTLTDLSQACGGDRRVSVARELTKLHEQIWRGSLADAAAWATAAPVRGEVVVVLAGAPAEGSVVGDDALAAELARRLSTGERTRGVVDDVAAGFGVPRRRVYELALAWQAAGRPGAAGATDRPEQDPPLPSPEPPAPAPE